MNYERNERIRRAAILVASLEESLAEQMLAALPRLEAARIRAQVEELDEVDPEEHQDVLEEFRRAGRQDAAADNGVEFTYSAPPTAAAMSPSPMAPNLATEATISGINESHDDEDAILMADLLMQEHPQIVAAALSRLNPDQAAAVFAALPAPLQAEVVDRLANSQPADEDAAQELQSQLEQRVQHHRARRERAAAGAELARKILAKTPLEQQTALLARLSPAETSTVAASNLVAGGQRAAQQAQDLALAVRRAREGGAPASHEASERFEAWSDGGLKVEGDSTAYDIGVAMEDCSQELERLNDRELLAALRLADEQTVQRALAVSSEHFLERVARKLPRRQASRLRKAVRSIGPARLVDLRAAQAELLRMARHGHAREFAAT
jgi:flagellar motor switch protein FliG